MAKRDDDEALPDAAESLRQLARLSALWRGADFAHGLNPVQWETLRFLAVANRFSNTPGAIAKFLGATKGTISQTVASLEKKGLISKTARDTDLRFVGLALTETAITLLTGDHRKHAVAALQDVKPKAQKRFAQVLDALVSAQALRSEVGSFGSCPDCSYFRESGKDKPAHCMKFEEALQADETRLICMAHQPR